VDSIRIGEPKVDDTRVAVEVTTPPRLGRFLDSDLFWVEYGESVEQCPDGILVVPAVVTLAPVAWAAQATITAGEIDATFAESLSELCDVYHQQYPTTFPADLEPVQYTQARKYDTRSPPERPSAAVLFSGGVDSLACYLNHRDEHPALCTIHGADISLDNDDGWQCVRDSVATFADAEETAFYPIRSNFREVLAYELLGRYFTRNVIRGWWGAVHYATGLPALCAPVAHENGYDDVYQASGYTSRPEYPGVPQPPIVRRLRWGRTETEITEIEMTRQEKIEHIVANLDTFDTPISIRSCYTDTTGQNCTECEKCRRTILGLCLEGVDPNTVGYDVDRSTLNEIKRDFERGNLELTPPPLRLWRSIQDGVRQRDDLYLAECEFYHWFRSANLSEFEVGTEDSKTTERATEALKRAILELPYPADAYLWNVSKSIKRGLSTGIRDE
jgi:hypothetical protein